MNCILESEFESILKNIDVDILRNKSLLITGANGLVGSYLIDFLTYLNKIADKYNYLCDVTFKI